MFTTQVNFLSYYSIVMNLQVLLGIEQPSRCNKSEMEVAEISFSSQVLMAMTHKLQRKEKRSINNNRKIMISHLQEKTVLDLVGT